VELCIAESAYAAISMMQALPMLNLSKTKNPGAGGATSAACRAPPHLTHGGKTGVCGFSASVISAF
jgi:hypothetical protein